MTVNSIMHHRQPATNQPASKTKHPIDIENGSPKERHNRYVRLQRKRTRRKRRNSQTFQTFFCCGGFLLVSLVLFLQIRHQRPSESMVQSPFSHSSSDSEHKDGPSNFPVPKLRHLRTPQDYEKLSVRINTWERPLQLKFCVEHYVTCDVVVQIQVVWCTAQQGAVPQWLYETPKVVVELHEINSLQERFRVLDATPILTLGVLSVDDDLVRPCIALESALVQWTKHPHYLVGFDARTHVNDANKWTYGYLSTTQKTNRYSLTLPRYAILHVDYLLAYHTHAPSSIRDFVDEQMNCEDIALSLWISACIGGYVPLLADTWSSLTVVKLETAHAISAGDQHKAIRDECVNRFAERLNLKSKLQPSILYRSNHDYFQRGWKIDEVQGHPDYVSPLATELQAIMDDWRHDEIVAREVVVLRCKLWVKAYQAGLAEHAGTDKCRAALTSA